MKESRQNHTEIKVWSDDIAENSLARELQRHFESVTVVSV